MFDIYLVPESLIEPNPVGAVVAGDAREARHKAAQALRIGVEIQLRPRHSEGRAV